jgi:hypothetical protein
MLDFLGFGKVLFIFSTVRGGLCSFSQRIAPELLENISADTDVLLLSGISA